MSTSVRLNGADDPRAAPAAPWQHDPQEECFLTKHRNWKCHSSSRVQLGSINNCRQQAEARGPNEQGVSCAARSLTSEPIYEFFPASSLRQYPLVSFTRLLDCGHARIFLFVSRARVSKRSQIIRREPGAFCDTREHAWPDFLALVEREHKVGPVLPLKYAMRAGLTLQ
jgi:hypothetical protein